MKVAVIPIIIGALGTVSKGLVKGLEDLEIILSIFKQMCLTHRWNLSKAKVTLYFYILFSSGREVKQNSALLNLSINKQPKIRFTSERCPLSGEECQNVALLQPFYTSPVVPASCLRLLPAVHFCSPFLQSLTSITTSLFRELVLPRLLLPFSGQIKPLARSDSNDDGDRLTVLPTN